MDDLLKDFLAESAENLAQVDHALIELERDPSDGALINFVFRTIHTIKGTCGFLALPRLERVSHTAESVLELLRVGSLQADSHVISDVLRAVDVIKAILGALEATQTEPSGDDSIVIGALETWLSDRGTPVAVPPSAPVSAPSASEAVSPQSVHFAAVAPAQQPLSSASLRVNVTVLDTLMNLTGELVLVRNQLLEMSGIDDDSTFATPVQLLSRITTELQGAVMKTRMQPVGSTWGKLPRIVRDIARDTGKQIELQMTGADTALDRQLVQALQDPLIHMIRNSADHGIERPDVRRAAGKDDTGTIRLHAFHEGGHVIVEINDDGRGIDAALIRRKAIERGLVRGEIAETMTDTEVLRFIFEPGFSTAGAVTHLSGRGVGMDVVRSNVEKIGGTVELDSVLGYGCTIRIRLPLTLVIVSALLVNTAGEYFAFPQSSVLELVRIPAPTAGGGGSSHFDDFHGVTLFRLRDSLIPVITLSQVLGLGVPEPSETATLLICQVGNGRFGIVVDDVIDTQDIVVKPVGRRVRAAGCYTGCTILGDGRVVMIVDPVVLALKNGVRAAQDRVADVGVLEHVAEQRDSLLLFDGGSTVLQAVPLSRVARLEEIPTTRIELADGRYVVQYRGTLLPLVAAGPSVSVTSGMTSSVIVFTEGSTSFGLAVNELRDIVEDTVNLAIAPGRPGVLGTTVIGGAATEVLDIAYYMAQSRGSHPA